jgi:DNA polymerase
MDFEVSGVAELPKVGADVWTKRPDTYPTLLSFAIDNGPVDTFVFDSRNHHLSTAGVRERLAVVTDPHVEIHAWNAAFEFMVWNNICVRRYKWPPLPLDRFHCTMARAACAGLPMSLDQASQAMQTGWLKDTAGARNMKRMARPRRDDPMEWWHLSSDQLAKDNFQALIEYNRNDVETERAIHQATPDMIPAERRVWLLDQRMQAAGLPVDLDFLAQLAVLTENELHRLNLMLDAVTSGAITSVTQNARLLHWLEARGYHNESRKPRKSAAGLITYPNTLERDSLAEYLRGYDFKTLPPEAREALTLRFEAAKTSTAKLNSVREYAQLDGHARYLAQYGGAVRTLRWAGRGPQIQNFPRPIIQDTRAAIKAIKAGADNQALGLLWGKPLDVVSSCLRGLFAAPDGKRLVVCDYGQIEARVVAWLSLHGAMLKVFADPKQDIYVFTAMQQGSNDRQFGKVLTLACGYGMGGPKFMETARKYGIELSENEAILAVNKWREENWPIVAAWHSCEQQAMRAIQNPQQSFPVNGGKLLFRMARSDRKLRGSLLMELPSKRNLVYRNVRIEDGSIVYDGGNQYTRKWETQKTYGGKLVENATQAIARDILADALLRIDDGLWDTGDEVLRQTVHDEIIALIEADGADDLLEFMKLTMAQPPAWAAGLPLAVTGYVSERYGK